MDTGLSPACECGKPGHRSLCSGSREESETSWERRVVPSFRVAREDATPCEGKKWVAASGVVPVCRSGGGETIGVLQRVDQHIDRPVLIHVEPERGAEPAEAFSCFASVRARCIGCRFRCVRWAPAAVYPLAEQCLRGRHTIPPASRKLTHPTTPS